MRRLLLVAAVSAPLILAACGQSSTPAESPAPSAPAAAEQAPAAAPAAAAVDPAIEAAIAALPAPYSTADYEAGRRIFAQCRSCHVIGAGEAHRVGPNLHGVFTRKIGEAPGFSYSPAVQAADFQWTPEQLDHWLANPREFLPGNRMAFAGVRDETQRRNVIAYIMIESAK